MTKWKILKIKQNKWREGKGLRQVLVLLELRGK